MMAGLCCGFMMIECLAYPGIATARDAKTTSDSVRTTGDKTLAQSSQTPSTNPGKPEKQEPPAGTESAPPAPDVKGFTIDRYVVEGNTIFTSEKVESVLGKYKGNGLTIKDIEQARNDLEKAYGTAGYPTVTVTIPEQTIEQGIVKLQVVEGRLGSIAVVGNEHYSKQNILGKLPSLKHEALLYEPAVMKELDAANANPDLKIATVLKPGNAPGLVNLELKVKDRLPVHARLEADNKGPITTPRDRITAEVQHANLFGGDEILSVTTVQTPTDWGRVQNYGVSFVTPIVWPSQLLAIYASKSISNSVLAGLTLPTGGTGDLSIAGNATIAGFRYMFPITKLDKGSHQLSVGMDYKHLDRTEGTFPEDIGTVTVLSEIQYTPMSAGYTGLIPDDYGLSKLAFAIKGYVAGMIPGGSKEDFAGTGQPGEPDFKPGVRRGSTGTFVALQPVLERTQILPKEFSLFLHLDGQWASEPLPPAEQYFAGGMDTVRGYDNYETVGDSAVRARVELNTPELFEIPIDRFWQRKKSADYLFRFRALAFYDRARLWVDRAQPGQQNRFDLEGVGAGIRVKFPKDYGELKLDQGWALRQTAFTNKGDTFVHFSVNVAF